MRLILVRHGQTHSNVGDHLDTAEPGADLTDLGREQARALPDALADERVDVLYASTLVRTQQTAAPLADRLGLEVRVRAGLREVSAGDLEMANDPQSVERYLRTIFGWVDGAPHRRMPGGETGAEVFARYDDVVAEVARSGARTGVLVSHGAVIRAWLAARADNITMDHAARNPVSNTGAVVAEGDPARGWRVVAWEGQALGGPAVQDAAADGVAGDPVTPR